MEKEITAKLNYLRISPRKVRLLTALIQGKTAKQAQKLLTFNLKRGALPVKKLLSSALSNAKTNFAIENTDDLMVYSALVDEGPKLKRWRSRARGRAMEIQKKTSRITIKLRMPLGIEETSKAEGISKAKQ